MLAIILVSDFLFFYTNQPQHLSQMIKRVCIQAPKDLVPSGILTVSICECSMVFCFSRSAQRVSSCRHSSRMTRSCSCHEVCEKQQPLPGINSLFITLTTSFHKFVSLSDFLFFVKTLLWFTVWCISSFTVPQSCMYRTQKLQ